MPRTIDLIRACKLPSNMMQFAAKGALSVPPEENLEILVHLAKHNKIFGDLARMTLAGWDEKGSLAAAANPKTEPEVLNYMIAFDNLRPKLLPSLLENPSVADSEIAKLAVAVSRESIEIMLKSPRVQASPGILDSLRSNPFLKAEEASIVAKLMAGNGAQGEPVAETSATADGGEKNASELIKLHEIDAGGDEGEVPEESIVAYLSEHAAEIAAEQEKPFQPIGGVIELHGDDSEAQSSPSDSQEVSATAAVADIAAGVSVSSNSAAAARMARIPVKKPAPRVEAKRENTMQKINGLDVKGRIQLALKGNKEERSILIRDGTKVVALAVLEAPKLSDGEVEKFALQKNVLEAVLRQIPLKRRFMKNYIVVRNLVANPRTPLDLGLGLMKHLLVQDLKNISANKEVSETVRKLALKMYKQKLDSANKK